MADTVHPPAPGSKAPATLVPTTPSVPAAPQAAVSPGEAKALALTERQTRAAEHAAFTADLAFGVAALQLILTIFAAIFIVRSFRQTKTALEHGERTLRQGKENLELQLRPYVHAFDVRIVELEVGKRIKVEYKLTNTGQSPAVETQNRGVVRLGHTDDPIALYLPPEYWSRAVLGAGDVREVAYSSRDPLTPAQLADLDVPDKLYILLNGSVTYTDTFGVDHITTYAFRAHDRTTSAGKPMQVRPWGNRVDHPDDLAKWKQIKAERAARSDRIGDLEIPENDEVFG